MNSDKKLRDVFDHTKPFIGFIMGGDGGIAYTIECALALIEGGVNILEIGLPFSDPIADGPVIQAAATRALEQKTDPFTLLEIAKGIRKKSQVPLILFSYYNPLLQQGSSYLKELKKVGFDGILIVDLPAPLQQPHALSFFDLIEKEDLTPILLITPSTSEIREDKIASIAKGFIYYVSQKGTTGIRTTLPLNTSSHIKKIQSKTKTPVVVGFGIGDKTTAIAALEQGDGFVVGSAFVKLMQGQAKPSELTKLAKKIDPRS